MRNIQRYFKTFVIEDQAIETVEYIGLIMIGVVLIGVIANIAHKISDKGNAAESAIINADMP